MTNSHNLTNSHKRAGMSRSDRRQREFERREADILDAALHLCSTSEFESVRVDQIAAGADIGKGTVYKHFASKDELLFRLTMRFYRGLLGEMRDKLVRGDAATQLRFVITYALQYHVDHRDYRYVVEYVERIDFKERAKAEWKDDFLALDRAFGEWGATIIQAGMDSSRFQDRPMEQVMLGLHACFKGAVQMLWASDDWCVAANGDDPRIIATVTEFMMSAVTKHA